MPTSSAAVRQRRLTRLTGRRRLPTLLPIEQAAALAAVGLQPVSEVMGAVASLVVPRGFLAPGAQVSAIHPRADNASAPTLTSSGNHAGLMMPAAVTAMKSGVRTALSRLLDEARAVAADGVVDVRVEQSRALWDANWLWTFTATGTAVRAPGSTGSPTPFTASLSAAETASALRSGWVPISYLSCPVMAIRWIEPASRQAQLLRSSNQEVPAWTEVVNACRHQARTDFAAAARLVRADGAVLTDLSLHHGPAKDLAEVTVTVTGTALAQFELPPPARPLTVLPLTGVRR